jgi:hypothetical protein
MGTINRPIPFQGTEAQRRANRATHQFGSEFDDFRCLNCDCKPGHKAADYPCGVEPPRETITYNND